MVTRYLLSLGLALCCASAGSAQQPAFGELGVPEEIEMTEQIDASNGTMSGGIRPTIRTNELFAAFQLVRRGDNGKAVIKMENLKNSPIQVPTQLIEDVALKLCTEVRTINGFYSAIGSSVVLEKLQAEGGLAQQAIYETKQSDLIDGNYTEDLMLMRSFVAPDCDEAQTNYFVPLYFVGKTEPDTFLAVFEIGNAVVEADLYGVKPDGAQTEAPLVNLECAETTRVDIGFDCTFKLDEIDRADLALYELRVSIMQPHRSKPLRQRLRISLPAQRNAN